MSVKNENRQKRERAKAKRRSRKRTRTRKRVQTTAAAAAAAAAAAKKKVQRVYSTPEGAMFVRLRNGGFHNNCGPLSLIQRDMVRDGFPIPAIIEATNDELAGDVKDALQSIRDATVSNSHGDVFDEHSSAIKDEILSFNDLVHNAEAPILTKPMWDAIIMRCPHGYFDGRAVMGGGEALDLDGLVTVRLHSDGLLEPVDSYPPLTQTKLPKYSTLNGSNTR